MASAALAKRRPFRLARPQVIFAVAKGNEFLKKNPKNLFIYKPRFIFVQDDRLRTKSLKLFYTENQEITKVSGRLL